MNEQKQNLYLNISVFFFAGELGIATSGGDYHHSSLLSTGHTAEDTHLLQMNAIDRCPSQLSAVYADGAS